LVSQRNLQEVPGVGWVAWQAAPIPESLAPPSNRSLWVSTGVSAARSQHPQRVAVELLSVAFSSTFFCTAFWLACFPWDLRSISQPLLPCFPAQTRGVWRSSDGNCHWCFPFPLLHHPGQMEHRKH
jgi:hypothetical protein